MSNVDGSKNFIALLASSRRGKAALERRLAELALGIVAALRGGELAIDRAWDELFSLENYQEARRRKLSRPVLDIFELGMELENVADVAPDSLSESYDRMERLAQQAIRLTAAPRRKLRKSA